MFKKMFFTTFLSFYHLLYHIIIFNIILTFLYDIIIFSILYHDKGLPDLTIEFETQTARDTLFVAIAGPHCTKCSLVCR